MAKPVVRVPAGSSSALRTADGYVNVAAKLGWGADNQLSQSSYQNDFLTRNTIKLETLYRGSWVAGRVIDLPADDMIRAGISIDSGLQPGEGEKLNKAMEALNIWGALHENLKWGSLYGGSVAILMVDGQNPASPLRAETVKPGAFKGLIVVDRNQIQPSVSDIIRDLGPDMGLPIYYDILAGQDMPAMRVHHSRVIRGLGVELPYRQRQVENGWSMSVLERLIDRLTAFDSTTFGAASLVFKAHLRTMTIAGLRDILAAGGKQEAAFIKQMEMIRAAQSVEGLTLVDAADKFETHSYSFSGLDAVLLQFAQQVAGATGIPLTRLFGQSPAGLNATGDSDIRIYYDSIHAKQESRLRRGVTVILDLLHRSVLGREPSDDLGFAFNPLWQTSDAEKSTIAKSNAETILGAFDAGAISQQRALEELRAASRVTGIFSTITDEEIKAADDEPPSPAEALGPVDPTDPGAADEQDGMPGKTDPENA